METIISDHFPPLSTPFFPSSRPPPSFRSIPAKTPSSLDSPLRKHRRRPKHITVFCSFSASPDPIPCNYGGWDDDLELLNELSRPRELDPFRSFLASFGIDRKHAFMYFLGVVSALVVFRSRFSSMALLPVSVLVFVAGYSAGAAQAGAVGSLVNQIGKKDGEATDIDEKMRDLGSFFDDLGAKMSDLKSGLEGAINSNCIEMASIKGYLDVIENVRSVTMDTKKSMEVSVNQEAGKNLNKKLSRKKREGGVDSFDFVHYLSGLFEEYLIGLRPPKAKDNNKGEIAEQMNLATEDNPVNVSSVTEGNPVIIGSVQGSAAGNEFEARNSKPLPNNNVENFKARTVKGAAPENAMPVNLLFKDEIPVKSSATMMNGEKSHYSKEDKYGDDMFSYDNELNKRSRHLHFTTKQGSFEELVYKHIYKGQTSENDISYSADLGQRTAESMDFVISESEASSLLEGTLEINNRSYFSSHRSKSIKSKSEQMQGVDPKLATEKPEDQSGFKNQQPICGTEGGYKPSSSTISADEEFNQNVKEAANLLKQARESMLTHSDEEIADSMLYRSARLLSTAVAMKPISLLAVGQLGNTYLLHGELKLKISRELRIMLTKNDGLLNEKAREIRFKKLDTRALSRENVASVLVDVCEECERFLVEAGRNYRKALSIDGTDIRALYNWGLALSFRAQLIADIGPEAAFDADKVYLAAIDKFNAMVSRSNAYAPDALYRWGIALQHRSHLRPHNSREKIKLLQQAKSLFEDVLSAESDNWQVRDALSSCISELSYNGNGNFWSEFPRQSGFKFLSDLF